MDALTLLRHDHGDIPRRPDPLRENAGRIRLAVVDEDLLRLPRAGGQPGDELLQAVRGDGEDARGELVAARLLEQGRVLAAVEEVLVGAARGLATELAGYWSMIAASRRTAIAGLVLGIAAGLHMYVMKGLQLKFGVSNFAELMKEFGFTAGISVKGTVFDPGYGYATRRRRSGSAGCSGSA